MGFGSSDASSSESQLQAQQAAQIQQGATAVQNAFAGFTPQFYNQRADAYDAYALPQLTNQYLQENQAMDENLADKGLNTSSAAQQEKGQLAITNKEAQGQIANTGVQQAEQLQQNVQGQENALIGELQNSVNPNSVAQQAVGTAAGFTGPSPMQPIGQMFSNLSNAYLANQYASNVMPYLYNNQLTSRTASAGAAAPNNFVSNAP